MARILLVEGDKPPRWTLCLSATLRNRVILAAALAINAPLLALDPGKSLFQFNCQNWSRESGLPAGRIDSMVQGEDGYIWLGSQDGLIRFDGNEFRPFPGDKTVSEGPAINGISRAKDGKLWLSFSAGGFGYFDRSTFFRLRGKAMFGRSTAILASRDGAIWTGSTASCGRLIDGKPANDVPDVEPYPISSLSEDAKGRVWIGSIGFGLSYWANGYSHPFPDPELGKTDVLSVATDREGDLWVATLDGLYRYDSQFRRKEILLKSSRINTLLSDSHGILWAGTDRMGLGRYQTGKFTMIGKADGLGSDRVTAILEDAEGSVWVGTAAGLSQLSDVRFPILSEKEGLLPGPVRAVCASDRGGLWMATANGATYFDGGSAKNLQGEAYFPSNDLVRIFAAKNGDVYSSDVTRQVSVYPAFGPARVFAADGWTQAFAEDATSVLVALGPSLARIVNGEVRPYENAGRVPSFSWIFSLCCARDGAIWVGTNHGITRLKDGTSREWAARDGLLTNEVNCVTEDSDGSIWASTTWGILRVKDDKLTLISGADGIADDRIFAVVPDNLGYVWLHSAKGLQRISKKSVEDFASGRTERVDCEPFEGKESVTYVDRQDQAHSGCKTTDGRIWFPSPHGVIMVDPQNFFTNRAPPRVSVEKVTVGGREFIDPLQTSVEAGDQTIKFSFSALGFLAPTKIHVRYKLEPLDAKWTEVRGSRTAAYDHLSPGHFVFRVQAANEDGIWNTAGHGFDIELLPPFYQRTWFFGLVAVAVPFGALRTYKWRIRNEQVRQDRLLAMNALLESKVAQRTSQLHSSLALLEATLESTPDGVLAIQISDDSAMWNRQLVAMWQIPSEILDQKSGTPVIGYMAGLVRNESPFIFRIKGGWDAPATEAFDIVEHRDGRIFEVFCRPQYLNGRISGSVLHFRDVTDRRRIEGALRSSEQRFKAMFDQAAVGVAQIDLGTGRFLQVNQHLCEMLGRSRAEMENIRIEEVTSPQDIALHSERMGMLRSGVAREFTLEGSFLHKDGRGISVNMTVSAMWLPGQAPDYVIAVAQDVSNQKRLEDQVRQSQKMEAIGTLAGGIAHDFNNILAIIKGYTEFVKSDVKGNPKAIEHLDVVRMATNRATELVRQILTFSRQQPQVRRPVFLDSIVSETMKLLRATIPSTIEFSQNFAPDTPAVLADTTQIHQIVMNLGTNAWQAMRERPGKLEVVLERFVVDVELAAIHRRLRPGNYARMSVRDTGCGIDQAVLGRIFEPFFTTKAPGEGTGLGLAVVHGIVEAHDGAITASSSPGEGTVFRLYFPEYLGTADVETPREDSAPRGSGERILLVDDEELLAKMGQLALQALGYEVEVTTRPELALKKVIAEPGHFALVITDQTMPTMTGLTLATCIKEVQPSLPVILMTGNNISMTSEKLKRAGVAQVLLKPAPLEDLGTAVKKQLQRPAALPSGDNPKPETLA